MCQSITEVADTELETELDEILAEYQRSVENLIAFARESAPCVNCVAITTLESVLRRNLNAYIHCIRGLYS